jgi:hypothetical protein
MGPVGILYPIMWTVLGVGWNAMRLGAYPGYEAEQGRLQRSS